MLLPESGSKLVLGYSIPDRGMISPGLRKNLLRMLRVEIIDQEATENALVGCLIPAKTLKQGAYLKLTWDENVLTTLSNVFQKAFVCSGTSRFVRCSFKNSLPLEIALPNSLTTLL